MAPTREGWFKTHFRAYRCPKCRREIPIGTTAYRAGSQVLCHDCGMLCNGRPSGPLPTDSKPRRKAVRTGPKWKSSEGAMPGEKVAQACADGVHRYEFGSVTEAVKDALDDYAQNDASAEYIRKRLGQALSGHDRWANYFTRSRFMAELSNPSRHLLDAVDDMRRKLIGEIDTPSTPRRKIRRGQEWGDELDADRWLVRDLNPWDRSVREPQANRTVTIGCNLTASWRVRPGELLYRGAAALALADILTSRGINVKVVVFDSCHGITSTVYTDVLKCVVKESTMPLDLGAVAFSMCEIAFFRVVFALGGARHFTGKLNDGLGSPCRLPAADREGIDFLIDHGVLGEEQATEWLRGCLAKTAGEVEVANG